MWRTTLTGTSATTLLPARMWRSSGRTRLVPFDPFRLYRVRREAGIHPSQSGEEGLVKGPAEWEWSSFRHYSLREIGMVELESEWTAHESRTASFRRIRKTVSRPRLAPKYGANLGTRHEKASPGRRGFRLFCSFHQTAKCPWGRVFRLPLVTTRERQSTRVKHRSRVVLITREARGRAPRVLTAPFGLDRSPAASLPTDESIDYHTS